MKQSLDGKFHLDVQPISPYETQPVIVKTSNGEILDPENEPVILFRARDKFAYHLLKIYEMMCENDGCIDYQMQKLKERIALFKAYKESHPVKQPGCTMGK